MEPFYFKTDFENLDGRSVFANRICKLIFDKHNGDIDNAIIEAEPFFNELDYFVRNIYELVENEIPLYAYYELLKYGPDNWDFEETEYQDKILKTQNACRLYYNV